MFSNSILWIIIVDKNRPLETSIGTSKVTNTVTIEAQSSERSTNLDQVKTHNEFVQVDDDQEDNVDQVISLNKSDENELHQTDLTEKEVHKDNVSNNLSTKEQEQLFKQVVSWMQKKARGLYEQVSCTLSNMM